MEQKELERLWRTEKYHVMYHSQKHYNEIRIAMREQQLPEFVVTLIQEGLAKEATNGSKSNACQHMWGYFKKVAQQDEKEMYMHLLDTKEFDRLRMFLKNLAQKYQIKYLIESAVLAVD